MDSFYHQTLIHLVPRHLKSLEESQSDTAYTTLYILTGLSQPGLMVSVRNLWLMLVFLCRLLSAHSLITCLSCRVEHCSWCSCSFVVFMTTRRCCWGRTVLYMWILCMAGISRCSVKKCLHPLRHRSCCSVLAVPGCVQICSTWHSPNALLGASQREKSWLVRITFRFFCSTQQCPDDRS